MDQASECIRWPTVWVWGTVDAGWRERRGQDVSAQEGDLIIATGEFLGQATENVVEKWLLRVDGNSLVCTLAAEEVIC